MLYRIYILFVSIILSNEYDHNLLMKIYDKFSLDTTLVPKYNIIKEEEKLVYVGDDIYGRKSMMEEEASVYWGKLDSAAKANAIELSPIQAADYICKEDTCWVLDFLRCSTSYSSYLLARFRKSFQRN